jgi:hypothetical protein
VQRKEPRDFAGSVCVISSRNVTTPRSLRAAEHSLQVEVPRRMIDKFGRGRSPEITAAVRFALRSPSGAGAIGITAHGEVIAPPAP